MTTMGDFINHLRERIMQLDTIEGPEALHRWSGEVGKELDRFSSGDWQVPDDPFAEVAAGPGRRALSRWHLGSEHVGGQLSTYTLDATLPPGSTVVLTGIGAIPVMLRISVVTGSRWHDEVQRDARTRQSEPVLAQKQFQANVHCPACQRFAAHGIYIPTVWKGHVMRSCACNAQWRQYTC